jgi:glycosyltransferase involved in cell wall biosynthesis/SAM-dependent methyltransferase
MIVCSFVTPELAHFTRVLIDRARSVHPDLAFAVLNLCEGDPFDDQSITRIEPSEVLDDETLIHLAMLTESSVDLAGLLVPALIRDQLASSDLVLYVDPRSVLLEFPDELSELARTHGAAFISRYPASLSDDGLSPAMGELFGEPAIDSSMLAFHRSGQGILDEVAARIRPREIATRDDTLVPWDQAALRATCHVSKQGAWQRSTRNLSSSIVQIDEEDGALSQDGHPVRSLYLPTFDPATPWLLDSTAPSSPRVTRSGQPAIAAAVDDWSAELARAAERLKPMAAVLRATSDGQRIDQLTRSAHRRALQRGEPTIGSPFEPSGLAAYRQWLGAPPEDARISRYLLALWESRADLQSAFPTAPSLQARAFERWVATTGVTEHDIPITLRPAITPSESVDSDEVVESRDVTDSLMVSGYLTSSLGLGEAARLVASAATRSGLDVVTHSHTLVHGSRQQVNEQPAVRYTGTAVAHVACVNVDSFADFAADAPELMASGRRTIGLWFWETSAVPETYLPAFELVDEIWVASEYVAAVFEPHFHGPIRIYPQPVPVPDAGEHSRAELGLPDAFTFLFSFDFNSVFERKNPLAVIDAFCLAFEADEGPRLVLKSINGSLHVDQLERLQYAARGRPDIVIVDEHFPEWKRDAWTASCDCYVSLHRSEGFGLTMAEAMACGKPVIATRFGGNLAFMNDETGLLVDSRIATVPAGCHPYPEGSIWADPDVSHAARLMRDVSYDSDLRARVGANARQYIAAHHSMEVMRDWLEATVADYVQPADPIATPSPAPTSGAAMTRTSSNETFVEAEHVQEAIRELHHYLDAGPRNAWTAGGRAGAFSRRLLQRLLRPYLVRNREFEEAIVETIDRIAAFSGAQAGDAAVPQRLDGLESYRRELDSELHHSMGMSTNLGFELWSDHTGQSVMGFHDNAGPIDPTERYLSFESSFRGPETLVRGTQRAYVDYLPASGPILDIGCGRGEMLELLREAQIPASGVDGDAGMVAKCRGKGFNVLQADVLDVLRETPSESLGGVFAAQLIEHLSQQDLIALIAEARRALRPGGVLIAETVNPHSLLARKAFWLDRTHVSPVFPEVALTMCRDAGFQEAFIRFSTRDEEFDAQRRRSGDYAVIARR